MLYLVEVEGELFNDFHYVYDHLKFFKKNKSCFVLVKLLYKHLKYLHTKSCLF